VIIAFFIGMIHHYVSSCCRERVSESQVLIQSRVLRENGKYIPKQSFLTQKYYFNNPEDGFFQKKKTKRKVVPPSLVTDPTMLTGMMKGNVTTNVLPMILIGGWINMTFSGFVTSKVPFPLTLCFQPVLQQGIEFLALHASSVSSAPRYFLNGFGLPSIYSLILDTNKAFKTEWEALELMDHQWALDDVKEELMAKDLHFEGMFKEVLQTSISYNILTIFQYLFIYSAFISFENEKLPTYSKVKRILQ
uniref:ER membrane protein complex subunit 3 n=1 Tax=Cebus imitator TaxID=2715852 RepID=A0A2K5RZP4_CEBIM